MQVNVYGAEAVGPLNAQGDYLYKIYGEAQEEERTIQVTLKTNASSYEGAIRALLADAPCVFTVTPREVVVIRVARLEAPRPLQHSVEAESRPKIQVRKNT